MAIFRIIDYASPAGARIVHNRGVLIVDGDVALRLDNVDPTKVQEPKNDETTTPGGHDGGCKLAVPPALAPQQPQAPPKRWLLLPSLSAKASDIITCAEAPTTAR